MDSTIAIRNNTRNSTYNSEAEVGDGLPTVKYKSSSSPCNSRPIKGGGESLDVITVALLL